MNEANPAVLEETQQRLAALREEVGKVVKNGTAAANELVKKGYAIKLRIPTYKLEHQDQPFEPEITPTHAVAQHEVANSWRNYGKGWWSQRDSNPCLSHGHAFAIFVWSLQDFGF